MAAVLGRTEIEIKKTGTVATVPDNPTARLMYYFDCVCTCVEADNDSTIRRLRDYDNYYRLSEEERAQLMILCLALSPDKLLGSVFFPADQDDLDGYGNDFYEIKAVSTKLVVTESILIGGQQKKVQKIMMCKRSWLEKNYLNPLRSLTSGGGQRSQRALPAPSSRPAPATRPAPETRQRRRRSFICTIL